MFIAKLEGWRMLQVIMQGWGLYDFCVEEMFTSQP